MGILASRHFGVHENILESFSFITIFSLRRLHYICFILDVCLLSPYFNPVVCGDLNCPL